jgi:SAM-dependent methyltransferase
MRWLRRLLDRLPDGAHVLDLGCGSALPVGPEVVRRHRLTGIDISGVQVELARRNVPEGSFLHSDVTSVDLPGAEFDAVVSFYAIDHIPRSEHAALLRSVHAYLRPGGLLLLSVEAGDRPSVTGEWLGSPMFFSHFDEATTLALVQSAGFEVIETAVESQEERGTEVPYLWLLAVRS